MLTASALFADASHNDSTYNGCEVHNDCDLFKRNHKAWFINAEFLYWTVNEGATDFALKMNRPAWSATNGNYAVGKYQNAKFNWSPGVRASIGYFNAPHYWDAFVQYTYLDVGGKKTVDAPTCPGLYLVGTWPGPDAGLIFGAPPALQQAVSKMDFNYQVGDLLASRRFHTNPHLRVNLFGGVTAAWIHQTWKVRYTNILNQQTKIHNSWKFSGAGLRIGVLVDWFVGADFYLTGMTSSALLSGCYKNHARQSTNATTLPETIDISVPFRNVHFKDNRLAYTAQFSAGPSWQKNFENNRLVLFAGYELTIWANLHQIYRSTFGIVTAGHETFINDSLVCLQGLTVKAGLDF